MKNYCKDLKSSLSPKRDKMVRDMTNYVCKVRDKVMSINPSGGTEVELVTSAKKNWSRMIVITAYTSVSKIFEAVNEQLPRKFCNRLFVLRPWGLKMKWADFYMED